MAILVAASIAAASLAAVIAWIIGDARLNDRRKGDPFAHCDRCGYDLTASGGTCPECGRVQPLFTCVSCRRRVFGREAGHCPFCDE